MAVTDTAIAAILFLDNQAEVVLQNGRFPSMSQRWLPVLWFLVATATLIHWERNWPTGSAVYFDGPGVGIGLSIILVIALMIRIFRRVEDILIARGLIKSRISTPYDMFPLLLIIPYLPGIRFLGDALPATGPNGKVVYQWVFEWGQSECKMAIYFAILGLLFLYRIHELLRAIAKNGVEKNQ
jgi:hypothetical protein